MKLVWVEVVERCNSFVFTQDFSCCSVIENCCFYFVAKRIGRVTSVYCLINDNHINLHFGKLGHSILCTKVRKLHRNSCRSLQLYTVHVWFMILLSLELVAMILWRKLTRKINSWYKHTGQECRMQTRGEQTRIWFPVYDNFNNYKMS